MNKRRMVNHKQNLELILQQLHNAAYNIWVLLKWLFLGTAVNLSCPVVYGFLFRTPSSRHPKEVPILPVWHRQSERPFLGFWRTLSATIMNQKHRKPK